MLFYHMHALMENPQPNIYEVSMSDLYSNWRDELFKVIDDKNYGQLWGHRSEEFDFEITDAPDNPNYVSVRVVAREGASALYDEVSVVYARREMDKTFTGIPLRFIVANDVTVRDLVSQVAARYGVAFDYAVDFLASELDKVVTLGNPGEEQTVHVPVSSNSFVWVGQLTLGVTKSGIDLITVIKNTALTNLSYLEPGTLNLVTLPYLEPDDRFPWIASKKPPLYWLSKNEDPGHIDIKYFDVLLSEMVRLKDITKEEKDTILAMYTEDASRAIKFVPTYDGRYYVTTATPQVWGAWTGYPVLCYGVDDYPFYLVMKSNGTSEVTIANNIWLGVSVDWGDGTNEFRDDADRDSPLVHTYATPGEYVITVVGRVGDIYYQPATPTAISGGSITEISRWDNAVEETNLALWACPNIEKLPDYLPPGVRILSLVCGNPNYNGAEVLSWDTSNVTQFVSTFLNMVKFNQPVGRWDVSKATTFTRVFSGCSSFNQSLNDWKLNPLARDLTFEKMLRRCVNFNQPFDKWKFSPYIYGLIMTSMFEGCTSFNQDLPWKVRIGSLINAFKGCTAFNGDIRSFIVYGDNPALESMVENCPVFNQDLSHWVILEPAYYGEWQLLNMDRGATAWQDNYKPGYYPLDSRPFCKLKVVSGTTNVSIGSGSSRVEWYFESNPTAVGHDDPFPGYPVSIREKVTAPEDVLVITVKGTHEHYGQLLSIQLIEDAAVVGVDDWDHPSFSRLDVMRCPQFSSVPNQLHPTLTDLRFHDNPVFNHDISMWDTSRLKVVEFKGCSSFNQNLSGWDTTLMAYNSDFDAGCTSWEEKNKPKFK